MWTINVAIIAFLMSTAGMVSSLKIDGSSTQLKNNDLEDRAVEFLPREENFRGCKEENISCRATSQCCSKNHRCISPGDDESMDSVCKTCKPVGGDCEVDLDCCRGFMCRDKKCFCFPDGETCRNHGSCCGNSVCSRILLNKDPNMNGTCIPCRIVDESCENGVFCCSGGCNRETKLCYCTGPGVYCVKNVECCPGYQCLNRLCQICVSLNEPCREDGECCSKKCTMGVCSCTVKSSRKKRCIFD